MGHCRRVKKVERTFSRPHPSRWRPNHQKLSHRKLKLFRLAQLPEPWLSLPASLPCTFSCWFNLQSRGKRRLPNTSSESLACCGALTSITRPRKTQKRRALKCCPSATENQTKSAGAQPRSSEAAPSRAQRHRRLRRPATPSSRLRRCSTQ